MNNDSRVLSVKAADTGGVRDKAHDLRLGALLAADPEPTSVKAVEDQQRENAGPVKVASFEC